MAISDKLEDEREKKSRTMFAGADCLVLVVVAQTFLRKIGHLTMGEEINKKRRFHQPFQVNACQAATMPARLLPVERSKFSMILQLAVPLALADSGCQWSLPVHLDVRAITAR